MCISCLKDKIEAKQNLYKILGVYIDLIILCDLKIRLNEQFPYQDPDYCEYEDKLQQKIRDGLHFASQNIFDTKDRIDDKEYLEKMNNLKEVNDLLQEIEILGKRPSLNYY